MRLFAIGDTHLPSTRRKDMHRFGWTEHPRPLQRAWDELVRPEDAVIVAGDISWASKPNEVLEDLRWLDERPGKKVLLRGNHDYWWGDSASKLKKLFEPFKSFHGFLHNSAVQVGDLHRCRVAKWGMRRRTRAT
jgi:predicted phosphohydrolase